ncbi:MAG: hypothetical protein Ct9H90mP25_2970 [Gammaproteobacteria bacterium]|nr:MAG: hypothetical protein Ct9H90mP25_2970 [Gammaproteobacteria bacterium]
MIIFTMYGGGFAKPYPHILLTFSEPNMLGKFRSTPHRWSTAGVLGPLAITSLRQNSVNTAINDLVSLVDPSAFQTQFGAGIDQLEALVASNTVNIARLMEIVPPGTTDPTSSLYNSTMLLMAVLLAIAFCEQCTHATR